MHMNTKIIGLIFATFLLSFGFAAEAQQTQGIPRIGLLSPFVPSVTLVWYDAFRQGLRDRGWLEGKNIRIEYRYAEGKSDRLPDLAADLVHLKVDIIVASETTSTLAAKKVTHVIPIVVVSSADPVGSGLVESLSRPGGQVTGLSQMAPELAGKELELLKEIASKLSRVAVLWNPENPASTRSWQELQVPARELALQLHSLEVRKSNELEKTFEEASRSHDGALAIMPNQVFVANLKRIADFAARSRLPSIFHLSEFAESDGLMTYGPDRRDQWRRAATYVDKILKGAKPADLPVEQPTKFELVINLKTAKQIGLTIPPNVLARADRVIK